MPDLSPEQGLRHLIDTQLVACGWVVEDYRAVDCSAGRGIALAEVSIKAGTCDYRLRAASLSSVPWGNEGQQGRPLVKSYVIDQCRHGQTNY